jgi:hypothetical protein
LRPDGALRHERDQVRQPEVVRAHSSRQDLLDDLGWTLRQLRTVGPDGARPRRSVQSAARRPDLTTVHSRLGQAAIDELVASFRAGTPKRKLAESFGISLSSMKRVLRRSSDES